MCCLQVAPQWISLKHFELVSFRQCRRYVSSIRRETCAPARPIDHSALQAAETHTEAFSHVILKSLSDFSNRGRFGRGLLPNRASGYRHRWSGVSRDPDCPFLPDETMSVVRLRDDAATEADVAALHTRSGGNPRVLDALIRAGRPYDELRPESGRA